jgi:hypothetical protein
VPKAHIRRIGQVTIESREHIDGPEHPPDKQAMRRRPATGSLPWYRSGSEYPDQNNEKMPGFGHSCTGAATRAP